MSEHPSKYAIILWDFDGVILDSMKTRDMGFSEVLRDYPTEQVNKLLSFHRVNGGLSRYVKFRYFFEVIRSEEVSKERINALAHRFSEIMLKELPKKEYMILETVHFIEKQFELGKEQHIVSGSDQVELRQICKRLQIDNFFSSIQGSPTPKTELVRAILEQKNRSKDEFCLIGDSINDFEAASENGIDFFGFNNTNLSSLGKSYLKRF